MSDRTQGSLSVIGDMRQIVKFDNGDEIALGDMLRNQFEGRFYNVYDADESWASYNVAGDCRCGSTDEISRELEAILEDNPGAFAYWVNEDPAYEWLGDMRIRVPGIAEIYNAECDANSTPIVPAHELIKLVDEADDLDALREQIKRAHGWPWIDAWNALQPQACAAKVERLKGYLAKCARVLNPDGTCPGADDHVKETCDA